MHFITCQQLYSKSSYVCLLRHITDDPIILSVRPWSHLISFDLTATYALHALWIARHHCCPHWITTHIAKLYSNNNAVLNILRHSLRNSFLAVSLFRCSRTMKPLSRGTTTGAHSALKTLELPPLLAHLDRTVSQTISYVMHGSEAPCRRKQSKALNETDCIIFPVTSVCSYQKPSP